MSFSEKKVENSNNNYAMDEQTINSFQQMIIFNDNLRKNIKLSLLIYKKINNFDHNYIHELFNDKSTNKLNEKTN
jgi:hypothetical protein